MGLDDAAKVLQIVGVLVAAGGAPFAVRTYWIGARLKRAEWLQKLYVQFYEQERYRRIRDDLDYGSELAPLHQGIQENAQSCLMGQLWDYLNFFEFVAGLLELKQIREKDLRLLLQYPLEKIADDAQIKGCLKGLGFEHLNDVLVKRLPRWRG